MIGLRAALAAAMLSGSVIAPAAGVLSGCAAPGSGGEWRSYGGDLANTRSQPQETTIGAANVSTLEAAWTFPGGAGSIQSTPAIADGCLYVATDLGEVFALDAETGAVRWTADLDGGIFSLTVRDGRVYGLVNRVGSPYAVALDQASGAVIWTTDPVQVNPGIRTNASAVVFGDVLSFGYSVPEGNASAHAGYAVVDTATGQILEHHYVIPEEDWQYGYGGGGIWTTAAVSGDGYAYVGTSNPTSKNVEHENINALLKIDLDRSRSTFGEIVDAQKGDYDQYVQGLDRQPACDIVGPNEPLFAVSCVQLDLDFGASGNLFTDAHGNLLFGMLQKSGRYHVVFADTMQQDWSAVAGVPFLQGNSGATAFADGRIYAAGFPGQLVALDPTFGDVLWVTPTPGGGLFNALSVANGVVYGLDALGVLNAFDAATGLSLLKRPVLLDTGVLGTGISSNGIAIARNTVYTPLGKNVVAYRAG